MSNSGTSAAGHPDMDYPEHERTYAAFVNGAKWATVALVILLILLAWFLV